MAQTPIYGNQGGTTLTFNDGAELVMADGAALTIAAQEIPMDASFTIGAEATNAINVVIQLQSQDGTDLANRGTVFFYLSSDANGDALATAPTGGIAIGTDGLLIETLADLAGFMTSEADGDIDVTLTDTGTPTFYIVLVMPTGQRIISGAITFA